ncbi:MAG TPA: hypothetical protein VM785_05860 [Gaiellales bacterium]|jgi:hypothetical protein|nr:hypothetical protein [Gaiellales bacterium]
MRRLRDERAPCPCVASDGFWAPDGGYALISQIILFAWIAVLSGFLVKRSPAPVTTPSAATVPGA